MGKYPTGMYLSGIKMGRRIATHPWSNLGAQLGKRGNPVEFAIKALFTVSHFVTLAAKNYMEWCPQTKKETRYLSIEHRTRALSWENQFLGSVSRNL